MTVIIARFSSLIYNTSSQWIPFIRCIEGPNCFCTKKTWKVSEQTWNIKSHYI